MADNWDEGKHPRDNDGKFTSNGGKTSAQRLKEILEKRTGSIASMGKKEYNKEEPRIKIDGPSHTREYIDEYVGKHPEIVKEAKKYEGVLDTIKNFRKLYPDAPDGTYSATTGKPVKIDSGYSVTFHQNYTLENPYGAYDSHTYALMCAIAKKELGSEDVYIGVFGNPEVSFNCKDKEKAIRFAIEHNQHSIYNCKTGKILKNTTKYNKKTNPIEGID